MLALEAQNIPNFQFVWFTDGSGWSGARNNLRETFDVLPTLFNINEVNNGIMKTIFQ
jgi:type II restriction enzyme